MSRQPQTIICVGLSYKTAPIELRNNLYLNESAIRLALPKLQSDSHLQELVVLSTCNRIELYGVLGSIDTTESSLKDLFHQLQVQAGNDKIKEQPIENERLYVHVGSDAVEHLIKVSSSLDSLVVGETQITGQFKDAIAIASEAGTSGTILHRLSQTALQTAKSIRSNTALGEKSVSISHAAVDLVKLVYEDIKGRTVAVIGAGDMAELAAKQLAKHSPKHLYIANRTLTNGQKIIDQIGMGQAVDLDELPSLLIKCDAIIAATAAPAYVITEQMVTTAFKQRKSRSICLVDIAIPQDIDPNISSIDDAYTFNIDDLEQVVNRNYASRLKAAEDANEIIQTSMAKFNRWLASSDIRPVLSAFNQNLKQVLSLEFDKSVKAGGVTAVNPDGKTKFIDSVANKLAAAVSKAVHSPPDGHSTEQLLEALMVFFDIAAVPETRQESNKQQEVAKHAN